MTNNRCAYYDCEYEDKALALWDNGWSIEVNDFFNEHGTEFSIGAIDVLAVNKDGREVLFQVKDSGDYKMCSTSLHIVKGDVDENEADALLWLAQEYFNVYCETFYDVDMDYDFCPLHIKRKHGIDWYKQELASEKILTDTSEFASDFESAVISLLEEACVGFDFYDERNHEEVQEAIAQYTIDYGEGTLYWDIWDAYDEEIKDIQYQQAAKKYDIIWNAINNYEGDIPRAVDDLIDIDMEGIIDPFYNAVDTVVRKLGYEVR